MHTTPFLTHRSSIARFLHWFLLALAAILAAVVALHRSETGYADDHNGSSGSGSSLYLDHFLCYGADTKDKGPREVVFLQDQFDVRDERFEVVKVLKSTVFCNPVKKEHQGLTTEILNWNNHLVGYKLEEIFRPEDTHQSARPVLVRHQFGTQVLHVQKPRFLLVPTQKLLVDEQQPQSGGGPPSYLDHFKCYMAAGQALNAPVRLTDQFGNYEERVGEPVFFCNPTRKIHYDFAHQNVVGIQNAKAHLTCYNVHPKRKAKHLLTYSNQFGQRQQITTDRLHVLCIPSEKIEPNDHSSSSSEWSSSSESSSSSSESSSSDSSSSSSDSSSSTSG